MSELNLTLHVWRQSGPETKGDFVTYRDEARELSTHMSFLEMLDVVNERLIEKNEEPIAFAHDCREGICGSCGVMVEGEAHGPNEGTAVCQLHMRSFKDGDEVHIEPWRAAAFPVIKDLIVDRRAFDRIVAAGGYISINAGSARDANEIPVPKTVAEASFDSAACIACGACVAACPNGAAHLFTSAKLNHLNVLPQGQPEKHRRTVAMVEQMEQEGFGACSNHRECEAVCPKRISISNIARMNRDYQAAKLWAQDS
ncbi:MAG: succinate dehydrogenase/fumarate reductase iron-sulfur subunit [Acidobacteriota bacterium]